MEWLDVNDITDYKDMLDKPVIVTRKNGNCFIASLHSAIVTYGDESLQKRLVWKSTSGGRFDDVTHWMPLPAKPGVITVDDLLDNVMRKVLPKMAAKGVFDPKPESASPCSRCRDREGNTFEVKLEYEGIEGSGGIPDKKPFIGYQIGNYCLCLNCSVKLKDALRQAGNDLLREEKKEHTVPTTDTVTVTFKNEFSVGEPLALWSDPTRIIVYYRGESDKPGFCNVRAAYNEYEYQIKKDVLTSLEKYTESCDARR